jgi:[ribosomal protein S18]-alanine N-acetyltransferase
MDCVMTAMQERHLNAVAAIECDIFPDPWSRLMFAQDLDAGHAVSLVALEDEEVIGYASCWLAADECTINRIACCRKHQRHGIATQLLQQVLGQAIKRGAKSCYLDVRSGNAEAQAFYAKAGFLQCGLRKKYYSDTGEDAVLLSMSL